MQLYIYIYIYIVYIYTKSYETLKIWSQLALMNLYTWMNFVEVREYVTLQFVNFVEHLSPYVDYADKYVLILHLLSIQ